MPGFRPSLMGFPDVDRIDLALDSDLVGHNGSSAMLSFTGICGPFLAVVRGVSYGFLRIFWKGKFSETRWDDDDDDDDDEV